MYVHLSQRSLIKNFHYSIIKVPFFQQTQTPCSDQSTVRSVPVHQAFINEFKNKIAISDILYYLSFSYKCLVLVLLLLLFFSQ